jgi:Putative restriction endonuclease
VQPIPISTLVRPASPSDSANRSWFETAGCPSYWVIDPEVPSITAWQLRDGVYGIVGEATATETLQLSQPFPIIIVPARLVD